jgi:hypothetical protein
MDGPPAYILTTSETPKHSTHPFPADLVTIAAGTYDFFPLTTLIDAGEAGQLDIGRDEFVALYQSGAVEYKGVLSDADVATLVAKIGASTRVSRRLKQLLTGQ